MKTPLKLALVLMMLFGPLLGPLHAQSAPAPKTGAALDLNTKDAVESSSSSLEDRVSKLENNVGKGENKVSVTISGWMAEPLTGWNDGGVTNRSATPR